MYCYQGDSGVMHDAASKLSKTRHIDIFVLVNLMLMHPILET